MALGKGTKAPDVVSEGAIQPPPVQEFAPEVRKMHPPPVQLQPLMQLLKSHPPVPPQLQTLVQLLMSQLPEMHVLVEIAPLKSQPFGSRQKHKEVQLASLPPTVCAMTTAGPRKSNSIYRWNVLQRFW